MEKKIFKFIQWLNNPMFIAWMLAGIVSMFFVPLIGPLIAKEVLILWSALVLVPLSFYFCCILVYALIATTHLLGKFTLMNSVQSKEISVKSLARQLGVSPRVAYFVLEMAERSGEYVRQGNLIYVAKEKI